MKEASEDAIERAALASLVRAEMELAQAGLNVAAEHARTVALLDELESGRPRRARWVADFADRAASDAERATKLAREAATLAGRWASLAR